MKSSKARILSLLLALALCLTLLPTAALAAKTSVIYQPDDNPTLTVNPNAPEFVDNFPSGGTVTVEDNTKDDGPKYTTPSFVNGMTKIPGSLEDPAAEDDSSPSASVSITFESGVGLGRFSNGESYVTLNAIPVPGSNSTWEVQFPSENPVSLREGYIFDGWYMWDASGTQIPVPKYVTASNTVSAKWTKAAPWWSNRAFKLNANGGNVFPDTVTLDENWKIVGKLPVPNRPGYVFQGWYNNGVLVDESTIFADFPNTPSPILLAQWAKDITPTKTEAPFWVDFYPNGGRISQWYGKDVPVLNPESSTGPVANNGRKDVYIDPHSGIGIDETDEAGKLSSFPTAVREGYTLEGWYIMSRDALNGTSDGEAINIPSSAKKADPAAAFTGDVLLVAKWTKGSTSAGTVIDAKPSTATLPEFHDVPASSPFAPAISWAVEKGITNGTSPTTFAPGTTCSTGHILTFLWRSQGSPEPTISNPFKDEIPNAFRKAAIWAYEKGLVSGTTFGASTPCTRAASVTYMWKLAGSPEAKASTFKDVASGSDYAKAINWAVEKGVTNGTGDGTTFSPDNTTTRGQIVTFLFRGQAK